MPHRDIFYNTLFIKVCLSHSTFSMSHNLPSIMYEFVLKVQPGIKQELRQHVTVAENVIPLIPKSQRQTYGRNYVLLYVCQVLQHWKNVDWKKSNKYNTGLKDFKCPIWIGFYQVQTQNLENLVLFNILWNSPCTGKSQGVCVHVHTCTCFCTCM